MRIFLILAIGLVLAGCGKPHSPEPLAGMNADSMEALSEGQRLYHIRGCAACHGRYGRGDGDRASLLPIAPRDLSAPEFYRQGSDLGSIAETIRTGVTNGPRVPKTNAVLAWLGKKPQLPMPAYPFLTEEERRSIAGYVIYLRTLTNR
ncbi:MAG: cytochrome c [Spirochaetia bacterium]|nr:cytochrome c [Spirochaetia bacterium]